MVEVFLLRLSWFKKSVRSVSVSSVMEREKKKFFKCFSTFRIHLVSAKKYLCCVDDELDTDDEIYGDNSVDDGGNVPKKQKLGAFPRKSESFNNQLTFLV